MNDNVRKVFDMLGVEPNEEFKIKDENGFWKIDEKLNLYYRQGRNNNGDYVYNYFDKSLIIELINDNTLIIKPPKTKKLRDLTVEEYEHWRGKNCNSDCNECLFRLINCHVYNSFSNWIHNKDLYSDKFLDQEIEVEE